MGRFRGDLPERTFQFALSILDLVEQVPDGTIGWVLSKQLARSGTSVGANVQEADRAQTDREFAQFANIARRETAETIYWLRLLCNRRLLDSEAADQPMVEANELLSILTSIVAKCRESIDRSASRRN